MPPRNKLSLYPLQETGRLLMQTAPSRCIEKPAELAAAGGSLLLRRSIPSGCKAIRRYWRLYDFCNGFMNNKPRRLKIFLRRAKLLAMM